jgi:ABC-2 type transport system permease protein
MFVLLFAYVFGGAIHVAGGSYKEYLIGGILVQTIFFGMVGPATSMATDLKEGVLERFRSLPMSRSAFLFGHLTAELAAMLVALVIMTVSGLIVGWRIDAGIASAVGGYALLLLLASVALWLGTLLGVAARSPDAVMGVAFIVIFPLTFISSAFVGTGTLPDGLRQVAEYNPISAMAAGVRTLFGNPTGPGGRGLAAGPSGARVRDLVRRRAGGCDPGDDAALPAADYRLDVARAHARSRMRRA